MLYCLHENLDYPKARSNKEKVDSFGQLIYKFIKVTINITQNKTDNNS
jgi:hypothetical protein